MALLSGCAGAEWQSLQVQSPYVPPRLVNLQIRMRALSGDSEEALAELLWAINKELESEGIKANYWRGAAPPPPPALIVVVEDWDPGDRGLRWLCGSFGCGEGTTVVFFDLRTPAPSMSGRVSGWVRAGPWGGSSMRSAEEAGNAMGCAIARGREAMIHCR